MREDPAPASVEAAVANGGRAYDGLDGARVWLIAVGNGTIFISLVIVGCILYPYYTKVGLISFGISIGLLFVATTCAIFLERNLGLTIEDIQGHKKSEASGPGRQDKLHAALVWLILLNFLFVTGIAFVTGGIVSGPLSPYILAMALLGQYLAVNRTTKKLLGCYGMGLYLLMYFVSLSYPPDVFVKPYRPADWRPGLAFLIPAVLNLAVGMFAHLKLEKRPTGAAVGS